MVANEFLNIVGTLNEAKKIVVIGHIMPDGDDISSVLSLSLGLKKLGKEILSSIDWKIPGYFHEIDEVKYIRNYDEIDIYGFNPDVIVVVDASSPDRVGRFSEVLKDFKVIVIDHHATNTYFGDINWVDPSFGATAQMVLRINKELQVEYDEKLALVNLMGIETDTGFFRYSNADERVFNDAAYLISLGARPDVIARMILENKRLEQFKLLSRMIDNLRVECDGKVAYSFLSKEDYEEFNCTDEDSGGFVSEIRAIKGVEIAIFFYEYVKGEIHISFRSKEWFDVSKIAFSLGGGGHPRAAGVTMNGNIEDIIKEVIKLTKATFSSQR
ncbi:MULTISPECIES: bifunctional oligoribonuclease/PAP phosphatase NrnA [unclassified Thermosipho (in: thermotogales)]|uniref:DHH family phosphoesterase n=1 Tax=unclassified Thermosipho (in: thermotogales) TaxID=2676525 RepID=UPI000987C2DD|nr:MULTISPECIES: bifunctional oligoribonuclease/PAP phosphatase NrnA [unclassified Thermosipho (in: thermotogales)]MBT1247373.1 phosphoesterase [Thermosipho sp. 1244]OOC46373.1 phosphoesterase [Thermosipho sp. 1223]